MTANDFLDAMKAFTERVTGDVILPCYMERDDVEPCYRPPSVYKQRVPDMADFEKKVPYIMHQVITTSTAQKPGERTKSKLVLRSVFCIYHPQAEEGSLTLLTLAERFRVAILKERIVDGRYEINLADSQLELLMYPEESDPFFAGEVITEWSMPGVEREDIRKYIS
jgi:hypothetical protein